MGNLTRFLEISSGTVPIILSCPHGGFLRPKEVPDKLKGVMIADKNKYIISRRIIQVLKQDYNIKVSYILSKIHRSKIDFNRPPRAFSAFNHTSIKAKNIHHYYHEKIEKFYFKCINDYNRCLFIDLHGFTKPRKDYPDIILGNLFGNTLKITTNSGYWGFSDIIDKLSDNFTLDNGLGRSNFNLAYSGGYLTHQFYKRTKSNALQIEVAKYIREDLSLTKKFIDSLVSALRSCLQK